MTVVIPPGYAQYVIRWEGLNFASGGGATVLGFGGEGAPVDDAAGFAVTINTAVLGALLPGMTTLQTCREIYWATATQSGVVNNGNSGTLSGAPSPPNTCVLETFSTGFKGPRARGRAYWPGMLLDADVQDRGDLTSGALSRIQANLDDFWAAVTEEVNQVILQRVTPDQKSPPLSPPPAVNNRTLSGIAATQRRRLRR